MVDAMFRRGAHRAPPHKLLAVPPFRKTAPAPLQYAVIPPKLAYWGNNQYGDCVSAEEAFAKACFWKEILVSDATVIAWARDHGFLDGADLPEVMDAMRSKGFADGAQLYNDGPYQGVDYSNEAVLQAAIATGPVKIAIDADALPSGAGNNQGWYAFGKGRYPNTDHCVSLCGYGPCSWLFPLLGVAVPAGADPSKVCYLLFTWSTIGVVDHDWIMGTCTEAYVRIPTTIGVPPLPDPVPPAPPVPPTPIPPGPAPAPWWKSLLIDLLPVILPLIINWLAGMRAWAVDDQRRRANS